MGASQGATSELLFGERAPAGEAEGLLVLHHGRGSDEHELLRAADVLDPQRRLHVITPRGPLAPEGTSGRHWYLVDSPGHPDRASFGDSYAALSELLEDRWRCTGIAPERTILGGFSMGAVMSYTLGLGSGRPRPAGILAISGFLPAIEGWQADLPARSGLPVLIAHGVRDRLLGAGLEVSYCESEVSHRIDPRLLADAATWVSGALAR
jgi:phospholipase/carboxylesterase